MRIACTCVRVILLVATIAVPALSFVKRAEAQDIETLKFYCFKPSEKSLELAFHSCSLIIKEVGKRRADIGNAYAIRAAINQSRGQRAAALADIEEAIKLYSAQAELYAIRGNIKRSLGDNSGYEQDWKKARQLNSLLKHGQSIGMPTLK